MTFLTKTFLTNCFCAIRFYSYGTAMIDHLLVYSSRAIVGTTEFVAYHGLLEDRILHPSLVFT